MKEQLYTIPLNDAFKSNDECPFCYLQRNLEQNAINYVLGSGASYMESDVRAETDDLGFCRDHLKKMYEYGNRLACGLILSTHIKKKNEELRKQIQNYKPVKISPFSRTKKKSAEPTPLQNWIQSQTNQCFICNYYASTYDRYLDTFFYLYRKDPTFIELIKKGKGFCIPHFGDMIQKGQQVLSSNEFSSFFDLVSSLMLEHMQRVQNDIQWFCEKFDYRNKDADWKESKDAIPRSMQKLGSGYPADPPFTQD